MGTGGGIVIAEHIAKLQEACEGWPTPNSYTAALDSLADAMAEQTQRTDQAWDEVARLREFGEHYSGAAQDAWDRIVVLEKALREIYELDPASLRTYSAYRAELLGIASAALAAGSA